MFKFLYPIQHLSIFQLGIGKSGSTASIIPVARLFPHLIIEGQENLQKLGTEWRVLRNTEQIKSFDEDIEVFWEKVSLLKSGDAALMFPFLAKFVFNVLSLPHSSANVERIFSVINQIKTSQRNRLGCIDSMSGLSFSSLFGLCTLLC